MSPYGNLRLFANKFELMQVPGLQVEHAYLTSQQRLSNDRGGPCLFPTNGLMDEAPVAVFRLKSNSLAVTDKIQGRVQYGVVPQKSATTIIGHDFLP